MSTAPAPRRRRRCGDCADITGSRPYVGPCEGHCDGTDGDPLEIAIRAEVYRQLIYGGRGR